MKKVKLVAATFAFVVSSSAFAASPIDWTACSKEVKQYSCSGSDKEIYDCLEKHDDDLGKVCQKTHDGPGDAQFGKK